MEKFQEKFELMLTYRGRNVYDTEHSIERFFERGLKHLRPKTYEKIVKEFGISTRDSEKNLSFVRKFGQIVRAYPEQFKNYKNLYIYMLKKGIDKILKNGDKPDQYVIVSKKYGMGIQLDWRVDRKTKKLPYNGYSATSLSPATMHWLKGDTKVFVERYKSLPDEKKMFKESAPIDVVYHRFEWPEDMTDTMFPAYVFLDEGEVHRTFEVLEV